MPLVRIFGCDNGAGLARDMRLVAQLAEVSEVTGVSFEWLATGRGAMGLSAETVMDAIPAADVIVVEDALETRLIAT